jgi:acyl-coenzyme A thioesterase PaaI-like protein
VVAAGRRTATAEGRLVDAEGRLYSHGTTTCLFLEAAA